MLFPGVDTSCKSAIAADYIQTNTRRPAVEKDVGADFLPTNARLREVLKRDKITDFITCPCNTCATAKPHFWNSKRTDSLIDDLCEGDEDGNSLRRSFTIFALAGCLFAYAAFAQAFQSPVDPVSAFLERLKLHGDERQRLFGQICVDSPSKTCDDIADQFDKHIRDHFWYVDIRRIRIGFHDNDFSGRVNLPFTKWREIPAEGRHPSKGYFQVEIDPDYCRGALKTPSLFLKRTSVFMNADLDDKSEDAILDLQRARMERTNLVDITHRLGDSHDLDLSGIATLLFAFETADEDCHYIYLAFYFYDYTLYKVLKKTINSDLPPQFQSSIDSISQLPKHPLWKASMSLVKTVAAIHSLGSDMGSTRFIGAHLDIKPENIVIDEQRLLLIDFEHAHFAPQANGEDHFAAEQGTKHYQPPESEKRGAQVTQKFDVWALGCVLLEVFICITRLVSQRADISVSKFREDRRNDYRPAADCAFWMPVEDRPSLVKLRPSVREHLKTWATGLEEHQYAEKVVAQIEKMLHPYPGGRPDLKDCLAGFTIPYPVDLTPFVKTGFERKQLNLRDVQWRRSGFDSSQEWSHCELDLWRRSEKGKHQNPKDILLVVTISEHGQKVVFADYAVSRDVSFIPLSLYERTQQSASDSSFSCAFSNLHENLEFSLKNAHNFLRFQSLMTQQLACRAERVESAGFAIMACAISGQRAKWKLSNKMEYDGGHVQILQRIEDGTYQALLKGESLTRPHESRGQNGGFIAAANARGPSEFRLAIFTSNRGSGYTCIVFGLDRRNCRPMPSPRATRRITFAGPNDEKFKVATITNPDKESVDIPSAYSGYPILASEFAYLEHTREAGVQVETCKLVELSFPSEQVCNDFTRSLEKARLL